MNRIPELESNYSLMKNRPTTASTGQGRLSRNLLDVLAQIARQFALAG
jgi:hypothetical protein